MGTHSEVRVLPAGDADGVLTAEVHVLTSRDADTSFADDGDVGIYLLNIA